MAFPQTIYLYQENNNPDYEWKIAVSTDNLPAGTRVGIYVFERKAKTEMIVSEEPEE